MKVISKIIIGLAIVGMGLIIVGFAMGGSRDIRTMYDNRELNFSWSPVDYYDINETYNGINNLDISVDASSVRIEEYSGTEFKVEGDVRKSIKVEKDGDTLEVKEEHSWTIFGFNLWDDSSLTIYVPEGTEFDTVKLDVDAGSITVVGTLSADEIEADVNAGKIILDNVICKNGEFDVDAGKIDIDLLDSQNSNFNVNAGKISATVIGEDSDYSYNAKCDAGNLTIGNYNAGGLSSSDSGGHGSRYIEADVDAGSININMKG
ncbi:MAG: DUF4097 family beta strand repeat-containing protein [Coprobacillaceae bacterium]